MAALSERTKTRFGRYRPFILFGGIGLGASFILLMAPFPINGQQSIAYLLFAHLTFRTSYTLVSVPYSALSSTMTGDSQKRTILSGYRMFFAYLGGFAISALAFPIIRIMGDGSDTNKIGFFWFAVICTIAATLCFVLCFFSTQEEIKKSVSPTSFRKTINLAITSIRQNKSLHTLISFLSCQSAATLIFTSMLTFYVQGSTQTLRPIEVILGINAIIGIVMLPIWTLIIHRFGKRRTWLFCSSFIILPGFHLALFGPWLVSGFVIQIIIMAAVQTAFGILVWSMIPDTIEYGAWTTGVRSEAATFGAALFMQKTSIGVTGLILGIILQFIGYDSNSPVTEPEVIERIGLLIGLGPALLFSIALIPLWRHPVTQKTHAKALAATQE